MNNESNPTQPPSAPEADVPPGFHPLEIAARKGIGPLSPQGQSIWHGHTIPCVSCGQLVPRNAQQCDECEQDLSEQMIAKMKAHAGPWYVLEHVRQFPGVTLDRIVRQIRRGVITDTSIVRGPWTDHQWRFTIETPGLCLFFSHCWHCHGDVAPTDTTCKSCQIALHYQSLPTDQSNPSETTPVLTPTSSPPHTANHNLHDLSAALASGEFSKQPTVWHEPSRVGGISTAWIAAGLVVIALITLSMIARSRLSQADTTPTPTALVRPASTPGAESATPPK